MKRRLIINGSHLDYSFKKNALSKHMRLSVHADGSIVVTAPRRVSASLADKFVAEKLDWITEKIRTVKENGFSRILPHGNEEEYRKLRGQALESIRNRVYQLNAFYGFSFGKISVRNQRTRWGSCSKDGNLTFHYKLVLMPSDIMDYVIVHELCHLREFNHSKAFWELVEKAIPDYRERRRWIKRQKHH